MARRSTSIGKGGEELMGLRTGRIVGGSLLLAAGLMAAGCAEKQEPGKRGSIEVTARLVEIPEGSIFDRELYNYANVLKYQVLEVHRGRVKGDIIYVGHYNPAKPRSQAADSRVPDIGGNLKSFRAGQVHRMSLDASMINSFTGGILNKYSEEDTDPIYWAVWTDLVGD
jgi:hypothetical protein